MRLHDTHGWHVPHYDVPAKYENLVYGLVLATGVPVLFFGTKYLVQTLFSMLG